MKEMVYSNEIDSVLGKKTVILESDKVVKDYFSDMKLDGVRFCKGHKITEISCHEYLTYYYTIVNYCNLYPTCYIRIPDSSVFADAFRSKINDYEFFDDYAHVHGGFSFYKRDMLESLYTPVGDWIGWDYAHDCDWFGSHEEPTYTTEELHEDVMDAIDQLFESEKRIVSGEFDRRLLEND